MRCKELSNIKHFSSNILIHGFYYLKLELTEFLKFWTLSLGGSHI